MRKRNESQTSLNFEDSPTMTEQHHRDSVNIHNIVRQHAQTGIITHLSSKTPVYADYSSAPDFYQAQQILAETRSMFEQIPAKIREQFGHDPGQYLEFIQNPENAEQMEQMGIDTSHFPEPVPEQIHLEEAIQSTIQQDQLSASLGEATAEQLQERLNQLKKDV